MKPAKEKQQPLNLSTFQPLKRLSLALLTLGGCVLFVVVGIRFAPPAQAQSNTDLHTDALADPGPKLHAER